MLGDPLALYRMPRDAQLAVLGLFQYEANPVLEARPEVEIEGYVRVGVRSPAPLVEGPRRYDNPDPEIGGRLVPDPGHMAISRDARERSNRFRVA